MDGPDGARSAERAVLSSDDVEVASARRLVPALVGPTAVGKTAVALAWAALEPLGVIAADARQVYRGLDIGTAKPTPEARARAPHWGLDVVEPGERYSAGRYARDAAGWLEAVRAAGRQPVVVGGTGLYVRALAEGLFREPALDPDRRERLRAWTATLPAERLAHWAARLDRRFPGGGRQRAARAVEVALLTGRGLGFWQEHARETGVMRPWYIHLTLPRDMLHRRIADRVDAMLAAGFVEEVRALLARGVPSHAPGLDGVGYREVVAMLTGCLAPDTLRDAIITATRRYAKRQETWFRHQLPRDGGGGEGGEGGGAWALDATAAPDRLAVRIVERWRTEAGTLPVP